MTQINSLKKQIYQIIEKASNGELSVEEVLEKNEYLVTIQCNQENKFRKLYKYI